MTPAALHSPDPVVQRLAIPDLEDERRLAEFLTVRGGTRAIIADMVHGGFQDAPLLNPWRRFGRYIKPQRARTIVNDFLLAFFDHYLRGSPMPVPAGLPNTYPDVTVQIWKPPATPADQPLWASHTATPTVPDEQRSPKVLSP